jgi:hypothetical protein
LVWNQLQQVILTSSLWGEGGHAEPEALFQVEEALLVIVLVLLQVVLVGVRRPPENVRLFIIFCLKFCTKFIKDFINSTTENVKNVKINI